MKAKRKNKARHKPILTYQGTFQTITAYQNKLKYNLNAKNIPALDCFWGLVNQSRQIEFGGIAKIDPLISLYALATSLYTTTLEFQAIHPLFPSGTFQFVSNDGFAIDAAIDAEGVHSDSYISASTDDEKHTANVLNMIWTICENGIYQGDFIYKAVNQLVLTGIIGFKNLPEDGTRTEALFQRNLGVSAYDYFLSLFALWSMAVNDGSINRNTFITPGPRKADLDSACNSVINEISLTHLDILNKKSSSPYNTYSGKTIPLSIFSKWPMINLNNEIYAFAGHPFMKIQITSKLLTKALALARLEEGRTDTQYSQFIGYERFEPFFGELCSIWAPSGGYFPEYEFDRRNNSKSPDWIAFEKHGSSTVAHLFQLKLKSLKEASHYATSIDPVLDDLKKGFAKQISQSVKFLYALHEASSINCLKASHEELSRKILSADKFTFVGVVPDLPSVFIFKLLREKVLVEAESLLNPNEKAWYESNIKRKFIWHIMELPEFQIFITLPQRHRDFYKVLSKYLRDSQIDNFVIDRAGTLPRDFRSYVISKFGNVKTESGGRKLAEYQLDLWQNFQGIQSDVNNFFFGQTCTSAGKNN